MDFQEIIPAETGRALSTLPFNVVVCAPMLGASPEIIRVPSSTDSLDDAGVIFSQVAMRLWQNVHDKIANKVLIGPGAYRLKSDEKNTNRMPSILYDRISDVLITTEDKSNPPILLFSNPFAQGVEIKDSSRVEFSHVRISFDYSSVIAGKKYGRVAALGTSMGYGCM